MRPNAASRVTPWRRPFWDEVTETRAVVSYQFVQRIDEASRAQRP
jgi:hypothetical protein